MNNAAHNATGLQINLPVPKSPLDIGKSDMTVKIYSAYKIIHLIECFIVLNLPLRDVQANVPLVLSPSQRLCQGGHPA